MRTLTARLTAACAILLLSVLGATCTPNNLLPDVTLTITTQGPGTVTPAGGTFKFGDQVTLTATANSGGTFDHWSGDASGNANPLTITMDGDKNITAVFTSNTTGQGEGEDTIASGPFSVLLLGIQAATLSDGSLSISIPLKNASPATVTNVMVTGLELQGAQFLGPDQLPINVGNMAADEIKTVNALFSAPSPSAAQYQLTVSGTFDDGSSTSTFDLTGPVSVEIPDRSPLLATNTTAGKLSLTNATFPPEPPPSNVPVELNEGNQQGIRPPLGIFRNLFAAAPAASTLDNTTAFNPKSTLLQDARSVAFLRNTAVTAGGGLPPDPTAAGPDPSGFAMYSVNSRVAYSKDFGATFTDVPLTQAAGFTDPGNPGRTSFFPQDDGGLCCDQVIIYIPPPRNIFVWLLQYKAANIALPTPAGGLTLTTGPNRLRIAYATPQAAATDFLHAWTWVDVTSAGVNIGNDWMDYPDLSYSNTFLYIGVDHAIQGTGQARTNRHIFVRMSLNDMLDPNVANVGFQFTDPTRGLVWQNHIVQTSRDTMFWAALPDTSTLVVFDWPDNSNTVNSHDIVVSTWCNTDYTVNAPDGLSWNVAPTLALGAARTDPAPGLCLPGTVCPPAPHFAYFAWSAGRANPCTIGNPPQTITGRPFPYVRVAKVNLNDFTLVNEVDIWNPNFAFATPALVTTPAPIGSSVEDIAVSLATGGGGNYGNNAVGFLSDFNYFITTDSDRTQTNGTQVRFGDYFHVRSSFAPVTPNGQGVGFTTLGYAVKGLVANQACNVGGCNIIPHFVIFGRQADLFPPPPVVIH